MKVTAMKGSEVLALFAIMVSVVGLVLFASLPAGRAQALGLVLVGVAGVVALSATAWAISEQPDAGS